MIKPIWIIQENDFLEDEIARLKMALTSTNTEYKSIPFDRFTKNIPYIDVPEDCPVIIYGSVEFVKAINKNNQSFIPGAYGFNKIDCADYYPKIPSDLLLNSDYFYITWAEFSRNYKLYFSMFNADKLFIRPNSGFKSFTGTSIDLENISENITNMNRNTGISDNTLIMVSSFKELPDYEYRFVIVDRKVVSGCSYSWNLDNLPTYPKEAFDVAVKVAHLDYQLDSAYTVDIVMNNGRAKIVELNSFSAASLYECKYIDIVNAVNLAAIKDYEEVSGIIS